MNSKFSFYITVNDHGKKMWIHCTFMTQLSHFTLNHVRLSVVQFVPSFYRNHTEMLKNTQKLQNIEIFT